MVKRMMKDAGLLYAEICFFTYLTVVSILFWDLVFVDTHTKPLESC